MRRRLVLVRHAKSAWDDPSLLDHDRPLARRGRKALPLLRAHLADSLCSPVIVLCSSSHRTIETLDGIRAGFIERPSIEIDEGIYLASVDQLLTRLRGIDRDVGCAMVIGHNPAIQELALLLVGAGDADLLAQLATKLPTAAAVTLSFERAWADLGRGDALLERLFMPRPPRS